MEDILRNIILVLKSIVDHKHWDYMHLVQKQPAFKNEATFRTKIPKQREWPILGCIALSTKLHCKYFLLVRTTRGWEIEGLV
jgi:hypothetical protein